jgi:hypothetical protein
MRGHDIGTTWVRRHARADGQWRLAVWLAIGCGHGAWRKPVGPQASCIGAKGAVQGSLDTDRPRRARMARYGGGPTWRRATSCAWRSSVGKD